MAVQLGLSDSPAAQCLGIRRGPDRRKAERRATPRGGRDRRRGDRRRKTLSSLIFSLVTVAFPSQVNLAVLRTQIPLVALQVLPSASVLPPSAKVAVSISFAPVPPGEAYEGLIKEAAKRYRVEAKLIRSVMQTESAFNPMAVSNAGALGLMQLMPELAEELGVTDPFDPRENIMAGTRHLRRLLDVHGGNVTLAVASYNAGEVPWRGTVPCRHTRRRRITCAKLHVCWRVTVRRHSS
jgi:soluble lytic murein transglycosylase-like protein